MRIAVLSTLFASLCLLMPAHADEAAERTQIAEQLNADCKSSATEREGQEAEFMTYCTCVAGEFTSKLKIETVRMIAGGGSDDLSEAESGIVQDAITSCLEKAGQP